MPTMDLCRQRQRILKEARRKPCRPPDKTPVPDLSKRIKIKVLRILVKEQKIHIERNGGTLGGYIDMYGEDDGTALREEDVAQLLGLQHNFRDCPRPPEPVAT